MYVSTFQSTTRPTFYIESAPPDMQYVHFSLKNVPLIKIFDAIKKCSYKKQIQHVHTLKGGYSANKKKLPCFTPSGTFRIRCDWDLIEYSHIVHLDYDNVDQPGALRDRIAKSPYCFVAFISPSGNGVKVFVKVNSNVNLHAQAWSQVRQVFDALAGITSDPTGRNLSRLCFISADAGLYFNPDAQTFEVVEPKQVVTVPDLSVLASNSNSVFGYLFNLTKKGKYQGEVLGDYMSKSRNNFLYVFACNCNRFGIEKSFAFDWVKQIWVQDNMGFSVTELSKTVDSAYKHRQEFATLRLPKGLTT